MDDDNAEGRSDGVYRPPKMLATAMDDGEVGTTRTFIP
jgi:hypothetical protein